MHIHSVKKHTMKKPLKTTPISKQRKSISDQFVGIEKSIIVPFRFDFRLVIKRAPAGLTAESPNRR
jgi:hypothetical protein